MTRSAALFSLFLITLSVTAPFEVRGQKKAFDIEQVRNNFKAASGAYFEFVRDDLAGLEFEKRPDAYWLVKVKPKKAGHYAVKYIYKYNDTFYGDGENTINVRVGGKTCNRQSQADSGIARFCLGDTVILPVRAANRYDYSFSIKYTEENDPGLNKRPLFDLGAEVAAMRASGDTVNNPLAANLKYLGTQRGENLHRNGGSTVTYSATFQAVSAGRFNLCLKARPGDGKYPVTRTVAGEGTPILILDPGTPITYLAAHEDTINYADEKKFSSHSGGTFSTNLLILQPGDVFSLPFSTVTNRDDKVHFTVRKAADPPEPTPLINRCTFYLDRKWGYNQFVADFFTK